MKYQGRLYAKVSGKYIEVEMTSEDVDALVAFKEKAEAVTKSLTCGLFGKRDSIRKSYDCAMEIFDRLGNDRIHAMTALHVVLNSIAAEIEKE